MKKNVTADDLPFEEDETTFYMNGHKFTKSADQQPKPGDSEKFFYYRRHKYTIKKRELEPVRQSPQERITEVHTKSSLGFPFIAVLTLVLILTALCIILSLLGPQISEQIRFISGG